jgi:Ca2+-binding EF-hand superfamily protein
VSCPDFIKVRTFNDISQGQAQIQVPDLLRFLERNGYYPRREDVESILRRIDHDANHLISYDEFCELTLVTDSLASPNSPEKTSYKNAEESKNV